MFCMWGITKVVISPGSRTSDGCLGSASCALGLQKGDRPGRDDDRHVSGRTPRPRNAVRGGSKGSTPPSSLPVPSPAATRRGLSRSARPGAAAPTRLRGGLRRAGRVAASFDLPSDQLRRVLGSACSGFTVVASRRSRVAGGETVTGSSPVRRGVVGRAGVTTPGWAPGRRPGRPRRRAASHPHATRIGSQDAASGGQLAHHGVHVLEVGSGPVCRLGTAPLAIPRLGWYGLAGT